MILLLLPSMLLWRETLAQCVITAAGPLSIDGAPALALQLFNPFGLAGDSSGGFFLSDSNVVRRIYSNGTMYVSAGLIRGTAYAGDFGPATSARMNFPANLASDGIGGVLIADRNNNAIRFLSSNGTISTLAGSIGGSGTTGDGGPGSSSKLNQPYGAAYDASPAQGGAGGIFVCDSGNHVLR